MMIRNLVKSKFLLAGMVVLLTALFAAGCTTTEAEKSGKMPNENSNKHVKGYQSGNSQAVRFLPPLPGLE
ncbi:MAG: hypothetical protein P8Z30_15475 [Acidobacteriota bacterium]